VSRDESISDGTRRDALILVNDAWSLGAGAGYVLIYPLTGSFLKADNHNMTIVHDQAYFRLISFSGTISYLVFHQKFHFFTLRIQRTSSVLLPYFGQSYEFLGAHRASSNPVASKDVWYAIHAPIFLLPLFFPIPSACSFLFSLVGPLLLSRLYILPRKVLQQESSGGAVRKCFEPFCAYTLQSRTQFQFATAAPLHPS